jgi:hypothetical protein
VSTHTHTHTPATADDTDRGHTRARGRLREAARASTFFGNGSSGYFGGSNASSTSAFVGAEGASKASRAKKAAMALLRASVRDGPAANDFNFNSANGSGSATSAIATLANGSLIIGEGRTGPVARVVNSTKEAVLGRLRPLAPTSTSTSSPLVSAALDGVARGLNLTDAQADALKAVLRGVKGAVNVGNVLNGGAVKNTDTAGDTATHAKGGLSVTVPGEVGGCGWVGV